MSPPPCPVPTGPGGLDPLVVDRDDFAQRTRCILCHGGSFLLSWLRLATSSSARFGAASPTQLCETFCTSSDRGASAMIEPLPCASQSSSLYATWTHADCLRSLLRVVYPVEQRAILVVDYGSTDDTNRIISESPVTPLAELHSRPSLARDRTKAYNCIQQKGLTPFNGG